MEEIIEKLKLQIIEQLNLEDVTPEEINPDEPLFDSDLGLDSIDALEIIVMLEREYGLKIESKEAGQKIFYSLNTMAEFVAEKTA
jgi:acyl carrier protein